MTTACPELGSLLAERVRQSRERRRRLTRTLRLVRTGHGRLTTRWVTGLTGWTQRSAERYLNDLWDAGLVTRHFRADGAAHRWSITDEGLAELIGADQSRSG